MIYEITKNERAYARFLVYSVYNLTSVYYLQTLSIWCRIKRHIAQHWRTALAVCLNISVHFLGPQELCSRFCMFKPCENPLFTKTHVQELFVTLLGYHPAQHLETWQLARAVQWHVVLSLLNGRIQ